MDHSNRRLILVKHAMPTIDSSLPAAEWQLSDDGRRASSLLAARISAFQPTVVVGSTEPKAAETAWMAASRLDLNYETRKNLHEHDQGDSPFLGADAWHDAVGRFFAVSDELVLGRETAAAAGERFDRAIRETLEHHLNGTIAVVAHGRVISLFVARYNPIDPFELWQRLGLPSFVVLSLPDFRIIDVVESVSY